MKRLIVIMRVDERILENCIEHFEQIALDNERFHIEFEEEN